MTKKLWLATCAVGAITLSASGAWAQAATPPAANPAPDQNAQQQGGASNTQIVVTAEKRAENIQHVPVAITAFNSKSRDQLGITDVQDLTNFTPGFTYSAGVDRSWIRGIGRNTNSPGSDSGVAFYQDGFFESSNAVGNTPPLFTDRIEVLNGPQGTLYGRNAIGGALNIISPRPTKTYYAEVRAAFENYDHYKLEGVVSGPITDWLRFRLGAADDDQQQGFFKNIVAGGSEAGKKNEQNYDAQLEADLGPNVNAWLHYIHGDWNNSNDSVFGNGVSTVPLNSEAGPQEVLFPGFSLNGPNPGQGLLSEPVTYWVNPYYGTHDVNPACGNFPGCAAVGNPNTFADDFNDRTTDHYDVFIANVVWHAPGVDVKYVGGYEHYNYEDRGSGDNAFVSPYTFAPPLTATTVAPSGPPVTIDPITSLYQENKWWYSHEINLISTDEGPLKWIVGAYYYQEHYFNIPTADQAPGQAQLATPCPLTAIPFGGPLFGFQCANAGAIDAGATQTVTNPGRYYTLDTSYSNDKNEALFGQLDWKFTDTLKLTLGARYSWDQKNGQEDAVQDNFFLPTVNGPPVFYGPFFQSLSVQGGTLFNNLGVFAGPTAPGATGYQAGSLRGTATSAPFFSPPLSCAQALGNCTLIDNGNGRAVSGNYGGFSGTAGLEWQPNPDTLTYIKYSRGYKSGGYTIGSFAAQPFLKSEALNAYELGWKQTFDKVFTSDAAAYFYDYYNDQDTTFIANPANPNQIEGVSYGMPHVQIYGLDWLGTWSVTDDLLLIGTFSYTHAEVVSNVPDIPGAKGSATPSTPRYKLNGTIQYTFHFDPGSLLLSATGNWRSLQYSDIPNTTNSQCGQFAPTCRLAPAYGSVDLRAMWSDAQGRYNIIAYVHNVGNENGVQFFLGLPPFLAPNGGGIGAVNDPRTYGIEFQYRFK
jgi:iron complex outermembrane receptor protein